MRCSSACWRAPVRSSSPTCARSRSSGCVSCCTRRFRRMRPSPKRSMPRASSDTPRAAGLINAILRRCQREHAQLRRADRSRCGRAHGASALARRCARRPTGASRPRRFSLRTISARRSGCASIDAARPVREYRARLAASGIAVANSMYDDEALLLARRCRRRGSARIRRRRRVDSGRRRAARRASARAASRASAFSMPAQRPAARPATCWSCSLNLRSWSRSMSLPNA